MPPGRIDRNARLERLLPAEGLNRDVDAASIRELLDGRDDVGLVGIEQDVRAELPRGREARLHGVDADDERRALQLGAERRAQPDRPLSKDRDRIADANLAALGAAEPGGKDVRTQQHFLVREGRGNRREVGARVRHEQVLRPGAVDGVPEAPAAERAAALRVRAVEAVETLPARRDGADDDPLTDAILAVEPGPERINHADGLVAEDEPRPHRILAADDMHVRATDRRRRNPDDRLSGARNGLAHLFDADAVFALEYDGFHR